MYATDHKPLYEDTDSMEIKEELSSTYGSTKEMRDLARKELLNQMYGKAMMRESEEVQKVWELVESMEKDIKTYTKEFPVVCRDGRTKVLVVEYLEDTRQIVDMWEKGKGGPGDMLRMCEGWRADDVEEESN